MGDSIPARTARDQSQAASRQASSPSAAENQYLQHLLAELALSKAKLAEDLVRTEAMLNSLGEGLIVTDEHGQITTVNSYALSALGFAEHELVGQWFPKTIIAVDQAAQPIEQMGRPIIRALTTGQAVSDHMHYLTKSGAIIPVSVTVAPIIIAGAPAGAVEVFRDLTDELQLDIAKNEFVSLASHQLRTPATGVKQVLAMLRAGDFGTLNPLQQKYLDKAIQSNDRQLQVIEDLLNVARVDAGKMDLELEYIDLAALLRDVIGEHLPLLANRQQMLELEADTTIKLLVDPQKIRMVIDNLISNASKYSPAGSLISIRLIPAPGQAQLAVQDRGVGIATKDIPQLFTKFTRLSNEMSASVGGTGLGLFLIKNIVQLHHGSIAVESQAGQGSIFTVCLPVNWRAQ